MAFDNDPHLRPIAEGLNDFANQFDRPISADRRGNEYRRDVCSADTGGFFPVKQSIQIVLPQTATKNDSFRAISRGSHEPGWIFSIGNDTVRQWNILSFLFRDEVVQKLKG